MILISFKGLEEQILNDSVDFLLTDPPYNISDDGAKPEWRGAKGKGERRCCW